MATRYDFHEFRTLFQFERSRGNIPRSEPADTFYRRTMNGVMSQVTIGHKLTELEAHTIAEWRHLQLGNPYVKVYPATAYHLANTKIHIEAEHLVFPFPVLEVRFPTRDNPMRERPDAPALQAILFGRGIANWPNLQTLHKGGLALDDSDRLYAWFDFGETITGSDGAKYISTQNVHLHLTAGKTVEEHYAQLPWTDNDIGGYRASSGFIRSALAIALSSCFFITHQHHLVAPDIAPRLIERFKKAGTEREKTKIIDQSKTLGHNGVELGKEVELPKPIVINHNQTPPGPPTGKTWESKFSHIRSGHLRRQAKGPRTSPVYEIIFIEPTAVRPDLPAAEPKYLQIRGELKS